MKYILTRINDGLVVESDNVAFVSRNRDGLYEISKTPKVNSSCSMYNDTERLIRTSQITDVDVVDDNTYMITTLNNVYKLENV